MSRSNKAKNKPFLVLRGKKAQAAFDDLQATTTTKKGKIVKIEYFIGEDDS